MSSYPCPRCLTVLVAHSHTSFWQQGTDELKHSLSKHVKVTDLLDENRMPQFRLQPKTDIVKTVSTMVGVFRQLGAIPAWATVSFEWHVDNALS